jgi:uncharacterized repeat protein (TIGR01451 family)
VRAPTHIGLLAILASAIATAPAQASVTLGNADTTSDCTSSNQVLLQKSTAGPPSYSYSSQTNGVVVSWNYEGHTNPASVRLRIYHPTADPTVWFPRSESALKSAGAGTGQVHANEINTFPESPGIPIQNGDVLGLTGTGGSGMSCFGSTSSASDLICIHANPDPPVGSNSSGWICNALTNQKLGVSAVVEPDADGDNFGDETQDGCTTDPAVHTGACPVDLSIVKTASSNPKVGSNMVYGLSVKNNNTTNPATGVSVVDPLPAGVTFVSAAASQGTCSGTTTVICALGTLAPGQTAGIAITVNPSSAGAINNTASVTTTASDTDTSNNSSSLLVNVAPPVPVVSKFKLAPKSFTAATNGGTVTAAAGKPGAVVSYNLNTAATTTLSVLKPVPGIKSGKTCVKRPKHPPKGAKKCTRFVSIGSFKHTDVAGSNRFRFTGRLKGKTLKAGSYRLRAVARNVSGKSAPKQAGFKIK